MAEILLPLLLNLLAIERSLDLAGSLGRVVFGGLDCVRVLVRWKGSFWCHEFLTVVQVVVAGGEVSLDCGLDRSRDRHFRRARYAEVIEVVHQAVVRRAFVMLVRPLVVLCYLNSVVHVFTQSLLAGLANVGKTYSASHGLRNRFEHVSGCKHAVGFGALRAHTLVHALLV